MALPLDADDAILLPTAFAQERLWFLDRLRPGTAVYNMPVSIRLQSRLSRAVLERCLAELVRRHEALRTSFVADGGCPVQVVGPALPLPLAVVDLRRYPRHERERRLADLVAAECRRPFELACGPLLRATLYRLGPADHVLLLVTHHIVADAWSIEVLVRELAALYAAFEAGAPFPLQPLEVQYADWAQWQRQRLVGGALDSELAFWRRRLAGAPTVLDLPADRARPELPSYHGGLECFVVDAQLATELRGLAQRHGCTLYMVLLAAFATMLARYAGQPDLLIGSPITNRDSPEVESVVGLFVNTVVLRVDLRGAPTVSELLERVRTMVLDAQGHGELPLDRLIEPLQPERGLGRHPLFQVLFSLQASASPVPAPGAAPPPRRAEASPPPTTGTSKFDLSLLMTDSPGGLAGAWEYSSDLFDAARIRRMSGHFTRLLAAFAEAPGSPVRDLAITDAAEERALAALEHGPPRPPGSRPEEARRPDCIHQRVMEQSRLTPDALAVEAGGECLTYAQLAERATALAERLEARGVGPDARVGLCMARNANLVVGALAILQAGGAYVPLDPTHPRHRLAHVAADAGLSWAVTETGLAADLPDGVRPVFIDGPDDAGPRASPPAAALPDNLAYVLYTSGTTGRPKGVAVPHRSLAALLDWAAATFEAAERARVLASTSICFDLSAFELFLPLTEGGTVVVVDSVLALASPAAPDVTLINTVPSAMRELVRLWRPGPSLRTISLAGEALARDLVRRLHERAPGVRIYNLYGPTETTIYSTGTCLEPLDPTVPSIGRPVAGTTIYVLDERLRRVPVGVPGELYIGGAGVARGYLGRPELTAERYLPDPFASEAGRRMYRTGDIARWRADGALQYEGRADHQVKLRGHRIELGEIETALRGHRRVRDAVVVLREAAEIDPQLVAYVTADGPAPAPSELDAIARRALPSYMVPSKLVFLDELPRTASGKVDRAALPEPAAESQAPARTPATETEAALCQLFAGTLGVSDFDPDGDFFAQGGHSLLATRLVARANEVLGVDLPLSAIFEHPTPARLAASAAATDGNTPSAVPQRRRHRSADDPLPLSFAQEGMWFYDRLRPGTALYNLMTTLPARQALDHDILQRSVDCVVARHEALRTRFDMANGEPVQHLADGARVKVALHDLSELPIDERQSRAQRIMERELRRPFDLRRAPLLRAAMLRLSPGEQLVVFVMHHIVGDGWSTNILLREVTACYEAISMGGQPALPEPATQYGDYVLWQRNTMGPTVLQERVAYFRDHLAGAPPLIALPTDRPRPAQPSFRGGIITFAIGADQDAMVAKAAAARGATPHMFYLAVFAALLHRYAGQDDVVIGIPIANRSRPEWRDVIGLFTNTVPVRVACAAAPSFAALLERVREAAVGAYAHEEVPFDRLVRELSPARDRGHHPIFQVMFNFQELEAGESLPPDESIITTGTAKFDLSISLSRAGGSVLGVLEYATDLFERDSMEQVAGWYRRMVEALAPDPDRAWGAVAPLDLGDRRRGGADRHRAVAQPQGAPAEAANEASGQTSVTVAESVTAARSDVERRISMIWCEVLGHSEFGVTQSFFEVGGHSLAAMCVMTRIAEECGVELSFERIFTTPTIEALAQAVEAAAAGKGGAAGEDADDRPALRRVERAGGLPLSHAQERLWFLDQLAPGLPVYNIPFAMAFEGAVDIGALERGLERLGERHESLRARFVPGKAGPEQFFDPVMVVDLTVTDLSRAHPAVRRAEAERLLAVESRRHFDLSKGPLLRTHLLRLDGRRHVLLLIMHHIVADARSVDILQRDLAALYEAERTGAPEELPELPVQYADFAIWQRAWLQGERLAAELEYWRNKMAGAPTLLALPTDRPRPSEQSYAGRQLPLTLGSEASAAVRRLASEEQATPFMVLLSIFAALLGRWSGAADLVVGTPVIGRPRRELEEVVGFFSNTLPMRMELAPRQSFRALLRQVREVAIEAFAHQDLPFERLVQELQPERTLAHNPLFQAMFAFQQPSDWRSGSTPEADSSGPASREGQLGAAGGSGTAKFDLTLFLVDEPAFSGVIEYRTDLFDAATIERFASHLGAAAAAAMASPDAAVSDLFHASHSDRAAIGEWNATTERFEEREALAGALVAAQAARSPSASAVRSAAEAWSYADLMRRACRLARRLRELGVGPDSRVAIAAQPSADLVAATVGTWLAGAACVPLDRSYPASRLAFMAADSGAKWLITTDGCPTIAPDLQLVSMGDVTGDGDGDGGGGEPDALAGDLPGGGGGSPEQLAYVIYTSGSTGKPKGVAMTHRALVNLVLWQRGQGERGTARRTLQFASPSFDVFFQEVLLCLATGGELVVAGAEERRDPALLIELCRERRIERIFLPYVALRELAEAGAGRVPLPDLREIITAGEQLQVTPAIRRWLSAHRACRLYNQYGPSETHVVTEEALAADPAGWSVLPPIGRAIANGRIYVLDEELQTLPVGVPGDLYLGGGCLARGYLDRPALTAERFLPDPYALEDGARMYRSGDRARWLADGRVEFLGRSDDQVKIRGYRVELGEVETALATLPYVRQAVVAALPEPGGDKRLVGYVLSDDPNAGPAELRQALSRLLPEPLVPATLVLVDEFPRTPSGKIDRRALPAPRSEAKAPCEPAGDMERVLAATWCEVLGLGEIGIEEDFFALGGHSLLATQVATRLRERLGQDVPVRWLFEHPTIAGLAAAIKAAAPSEIVASGGAKDEVEPLARDGSPLPSSFAQERLWFLDRIAPGSPLYNLTSGYALPPSLNVEALHRSLDELVGRHEALRTVFREVDGHPVQVVSPATGAAMEVIDLSFLPADDREAEARCYAEDEARRPFDLAAGPLFRATLLSLGSHYVLLLSIHHIIADAWSLQILQRDLFTTYEAFERGSRPSLPRLRVHYADFAAWQRRVLSGEALDGLIAYWRTHLEDAPQRLELPTDRPRPKSPALRGGSYAFELDTDLVCQLHALARSEGATLFMTALTVYLELIRRYSRQDDFLVGTPIGARPRTELEDVIGLFVNTLVLRGDLSGDPSFRDLLRRVRVETIAAYAHADLPFERLVEELQPKRDLGFNPLVQAAFGLHHAAAAEAVGDGSAYPAGSPQSTPLPGNGTAKFELSLVMTEAQGRLSAVFEYDQDIFDAATVARMATQLESVARQAVLAPDAPLSRWDLVTEAEARDVLGTWARGAEMPAEIGLAERVAAHAERDPTSLAVEAPDGRLGYAELDQRARELAGTLRALGVAAEARVGVCLGNSLHLPVSLIAILRAGGAYVPLDPALPLSRLLYMIGDAGVRLLITDRAGAERLQGCGARIVCTDALGDEPAVADDAPVAIDPDQLAYVVYTSGSTGKPKGVMATHRGLRALLAAQSHGLGLGPADRVLKFATLSFDASIFEMALAFAAGATLCLEPQDDLLPGPGLVALLKRRDITMVTLPPSSLAVLPTETCAALRLVFVAGEACPAELVTRWARGRRMINGYGPTETTVWASFADCVPDGRAPPIGRPVTNGVVRILDPHMRPVPVGVPGELCIGGPAVARGYLGRPDLTAASFVPDPWGGPGARMYRTGDLARWREDGSICFLGRLDEQIKLRGVRIEPGEIEGAIAAMPGVAYCVVLLREDRPGNPALVAYVVPAPSAVLDGTAIRRTLQEQLPRHLVPSQVMVCAELPRSPSGKLDRRALPAPPTVRRKAPSAPRSSVEEAVCRICADILGVPTHRDDNFFELGGHSLLLTRVLSRIRDELGIDVPLRRMFETATLAEFCDGLAADEPRRRLRIPRLSRTAGGRRPRLAEKAAASTADHATPTDEGGQPQDGMMA